ncbi:MAG TPA: HAMP domain-containing sensor histidine kinase [Kofleriaceae bacterium]
MPAQDHVVQFYDTDDQLVGIVGAYLAAGVAHGEHAVVIATPPHRAALLQQLPEPEAARATFLDARATLDELMVGDSPDWSRFERIVGAALGSSDRSPVRAYGEMVDLLWRDDKRAAALQLEGYWNRLRDARAFSLLCTYRATGFARDEFREVCAAHGNEHDLELVHELAAKRQLESALRDALSREQALRIDAERHVEFVEAFCGALAHTLRNPLGAILMGSKHLARQGLGERATTLATRIATSAEHMSRMIDELVDLATVRTTGTLPLDRTHLDLADICERVATEHEASAPRCRLALESSGNTVGLWDRDRLMQCFGSVVGNAIAHGATTCTLQVTADRHDPAWVVAEIWSSAAIPAELLASVFEPFGALQGPGLGLTMFISRQIALAHGGTLELTSTSADGTRAIVRLPRFPSTSQAASEVCASGKPAAAQPLVPPSRL